MERLHVTLRGIALSLMCLHVLTCGCNAYSQLELVTANTTAAVGETMTLECRFSERIGIDGGYSVHFKKATVVIGACSNNDRDPGDECFQYESSRDSRFTLAMRHQQEFNLTISDISISDAGSYQCNLFFQNNSESSTHSSNVLQVLVVPLKTTGLPESFGHTPTPTTTPSSKGTTLRTTFSTTGSTLTSKSSLIPTTKTSTKISPGTTRGSSKQSILATNSSRIYLTTKDHKTEQTPQVTHSNFLRTSTSHFPPDKTDTTQGKKKISQINITDIVFLFYIWEEARGPLARVHYGFVAQGFAD